jgi:hypothetical protein
MNTFISILAGIGIIAPVIAVTLAISAHFSNENSMRKANEHNEQTLLIIQQYQKQIDDIKSQCTKGGYNG